jgi:hypothetical protein
LIAYWKFDEGSGGVTYDATGNGNNGVLINGATFTNSTLPALQFGNPFALSLPRNLSHQYVYVGNRINLATSSFTVAGFSRLSENGGYQKTWILGQGTQNTDKGLVLGYRENTHFTCAFYSDDLDTAYGWNDWGQWHHWACTFDATSFERKLYRDGVLVASDHPKGMFQASGDFTLGRAPWGQGYFEGQLDDWRVYNRALSASEILSLAQGNR